MKKEYLPSKRFTKRVIVLFCIGAAVFVIIKIIPPLRAKLSGKASAQKLLVKDLVEQDSNSNGIADWEEVLWGLDPKGDGPSNKELILAKKKTLQDSGATSTTASAGETDQLSQQLLALIVSLQQSGNLNDDAVQKIGDSVGQQIVAAPLPDVYAKSSLTIVDTTPASTRSYYDLFTKLVKKYEGQDIGNELVFINQAVAHKDAGTLRAVAQVASAYHNFGHDLMQIPVPTSLASLDLSIANSYEKNAQSIQAMSTLVENPLTGMTTLIAYKKYNDELVGHLGELQNFFTRNGILKSN